MHVTKTDLLSLWLDLSSNRAVSHHSFHKFEETSTGTADILHIVRGHVNVLQKSYNIKRTQLKHHQHLHGLIMEVSRIDEERQ